jgi:hypothetical protein
MIRARDRAGYQITAGFTWLDRQLGDGDSTECDDRHRDGAVRDIVPKQTPPISAAGTDPAARIEHCRLEVVMSTVTLGRKSLAHIGAALAALVLIAFTADGALAGDSHHKHHRHRHHHHHNHGFFSFQFGSPRYYVPPAYYYYPPPRYYYYPPPAYYAPGPSLNIVIPFGKRR